MKPRDKPTVNKCAVECLHCVTDCSIGTILWYEHYFCLERQPLYFHAGFICRLWLLGVIRGKNFICRHSMSRIPELQWGRQVCSGKRYVLPTITGPRCVQIYRQVSQVCAEWRQSRQMERRASKGRVLVCCAASPPVPTPDFSVWLLWHKPEYSAPVRRKARSWASSSSS